MATTLHRFVKNCLKDVWGSHSTGQICSGNSALNPRLPQRRYDNILALRSFLAFFCTSRTTVGLKATICHMLGFASWNSWMTFKTFCRQYGKAPFHALTPAMLSPLRATKVPWSRTSRNGAEIWDWFQMKKHEETILTLTVSPQPRNCLTW